MKNSKKVLSLSLAAIMLSSATALAIPSDTILIGHNAYEILALDNMSPKLEYKITHAMLYEDDIYYNMEGSTEGFVNIFDDVPMDESIQSELKNVVLTKTDGTRELFDNFTDEEGLVTADLDSQNSIFFGVVDDIIADKIEIVGTDNKSNRYYIESKTDLYNFELGKNDIKDIYDPSFNLKDIQQKNINELLHETDIVHIEVKDDNSVDTMVVIHIPEDEYFQTNVLNENYIKNLDNKKSWEIDDNTNIYLLGDNNNIDDVEIYDNVGDFLKDYNIDDDLSTLVTVSVIEAQYKNEDLADIIVVKNAIENDDLNDDMIVKITDIDIDGDAISLVFENADGKSAEYLVKENTAAYYALDGDSKNLANKLNISETKAKTMLLRADDIIKIEYRDSDKLINSVEGYITKDSKNSNYKIYRLLDTKDSGEFVLGYDKNGKVFENIKGEYSTIDEDDYYEELADMNKTAFENIGGICEVKINEDANLFDSQNSKFIMLHVNTETNNIDVTVEIDEDDVAYDFEADVFSTVRIKE